MTQADLPDVSGATNWRPLAGGDICRAWRAQLGAAQIVVKQTPYPAQIEADGLRALAAAGAPVPAVRSASGDVLVMDYVSGPPDWPALGAALAALHRHTGPSFGWDRDNRIGSLVQPNTRSPDWPTFYANCRIRPHLDAPALPAGVRRRLEAGLDGPLAQLLPASPPASLIHGDLWSGNVVDGRWLIDPAVAHADREYELAFMDVFGGFPPALWDAYHAEWPLDPGWAQRRSALQLSHLLVHVRLFGAGYVGSVVARLDALGW